MLLLGLANELLICIAEQLEKESDINAFAQANRQLCYLLNPILYRHNIQQSKSSGLFWASRSGKKASIERFLEEGANVDVEKLFPKGHSKKAGTLLLEDLDGETVSLENYYKIKPLAFAVHNGHAEVVELLLDNGADCNAMCNMRPLLQDASNCGYTKIVRLLLDKGADVDPEYEYQGTALSDAAGESYEDIVRLLLDAGADSNRSWKGYLNPLEAAVLAKSEKIVTLLLENGASERLDRALYNAARKGLERIAKILLDNGANPNAYITNQSLGIQYYYGNPLQAASARGHEQTVRLLLDAGAEVNTQGGDYGNALQAASFEGHAQVVKMLLKANANVHGRVRAYGIGLLNNVSNHEQMDEVHGNPIRAAMAGGHDEVVELLRDAGASEDLYKYR